MHYVAITPESIFGLGETPEEALNEAIQGGYGSREEYELAMEERGHAPFEVRACTVRLAKHVDKYGFGKSDSYDITPEGLVDLED